MVAAQSTEAGGRLLPSPHVSPPHAARTRQWVVRMAHEAIQLSRADREAGNRAAAIRWLALASHLRLTAAALRRGL